MKVAFRADASLQIGSGHVMRCLTLAEGLKAKGAECHFVCREHPGHLIEHIRQRGFPVTSLPAIEDSSPNDALPVYASWLGCDWKEDMHQTRDALSSIRPDWMVVDHYALDSRWEIALKGYYKRLMVIDDLADRHHDCDLLLDQNLGRENREYSVLAPGSCTLLIGPRYALLRPEFSEFRDYSLNRRKEAVLRQLLITMGGVDKDNVTGQVLTALHNCQLPEDCKILVIMGATAPWLDQVHSLAEQLPWDTEVKVNIGNMAQCMAESDLAIGAAGSTSWERCCLGLPSLMVVLAENQRSGASALEKNQAAQLIEGDISSVLPVLIRHVQASDLLQFMSDSASRICDGGGVGRVINSMEMVYAGT